MSNRWFLGNFVEIFYFFKIPGVGKCFLGTNMAYYMMLVDVFSMLSSVFKYVLEIKEEMFRKMFHILPKKPQLVKIDCNEPPDL